MRRTIVILIAMALAVGTLPALSKDAKPIWVDFDFNSIPEPKARSGGYYTAFFRSEFIEQLKQNTDLTRALGNDPSRASNVNAFDEVPDSSWYTNRHGLRPMNTAELVRGPNAGEAPDFSRGVITKAKQDGVTPGLQLIDNKGQAYLVKFDNKDYPELQSGAEVISTKILFAAGYNVPENYIARLNPDHLEIRPGVEIGRGRSKRAFVPDDLKKVLKNAARLPDGTYRVLASKILKGTPKGPFPYIGVRSDDPNDLIPHEDRRELRGLRVLASWINHWDLKEMNTLDMYVEEGGRKFLRHYLIDFGSALGGGRVPTEYFHGREYAFDQVSILKELFTLGVYVSADEKSSPIAYPAVGLFSAEDFDAGKWKTSFYTPPFDRMTAEDAFWATRIMMSFSEADLRHIVKTAEYSDPRAAEEILATLRARRELIARRWLKDVNPIANFAVSMEPDGVVLRFDDLSATHRLDGPAEYSYVVTDAVRSSRDRTERGIGVTNANRIVVGKPTQTTCVHVWSRREGATRPVNVCVTPNSAGIYRISSIDRQ